MRFLCLFFFFFFTENKPLVTGPNQKVYRNGTLHIYKISKATDEGEYSCLAKNRAGQQAEGQTEFKVIGEFARLARIN